MQSTGKPSSCNFLFCSSTASAAGSTSALGIARLDVATSSSPTALASLRFALGLALLLDVAASTSSSSEDDGVSSVTSSLLSDSLFFLDLLRFAFGTSVLLFLPLRFTFLAFPPSLRFTVSLGLDEDETSWGFETLLLEAFLAHWSVASARSWIIAAIIELVVASLRSSIIYRV